MDALDQVQERLHLSVRLIKKLRRKLLELMDFNNLSPKYRKGLSTSQVERVKVGQYAGPKMVESDVQDVKEASGLIHSLLSGTIHRAAMKNCAQISLFSHENVDTSGDIDGSGNLSSHVHIDNERTRSPIGVQSSPSFVSAY